MKHRTILHRIAWNWRVHGVPRCPAWFPMSDRPHCHRLIWPWQATGGNGEDVEHYGCMVRERAERDRADALEDDMCPNCVTPWKCNGPHLLTA